MQCYGTYKDVLTSVADLNELSHVELVSDRPLVSNQISASGDNPEEAEQLERQVFSFIMLLDPFLLCRTPQSIRESCRFHTCFSITHDFVAF